MFLFIKELVRTFSFNFILFIVLIIGLQNSTAKNKVNFLINETINLPIGFIVGTSFITGSLLGGILSLKLNPKK